MEPVSGVTGTAGAAYVAMMAERSNNQQKVDGANAVRLVEAAKIPPAVTASRTLPPDATISIRV